MGRWSTHDDHRLTIDHWSNGAPYAGTSGRFADVTNPATGQVTGRVALASRGDAEAVIAAGRRGRPRVGPRPRSRGVRRCCSRSASCSTRRKDELAAIITAEHGKVLSDALGEIARGQEVVEFACGISHLLKGGHSESVSTGVDVHSKRDPLGVVGIISPFNFPAMVPMWFFPIAIAAGNTVVLKPSEKDPSAALLDRAAVEGGRPPRRRLQRAAGRQGGGRRAAAEPGRRRRSASSARPRSPSTSTSRPRRHGKRVQALGGAKNHMVVLPDADLDLAADSAVNAGYGCAGERCMAISVLVAVGPIGDELVARIADRTRNLVIGDGSADATGSAGSGKEADMGPLVTQGPPRQGVRATSTPASATAPRSSSTAARSPRRGAEDGFWLGPTLFDNVTPDMEIYREEIFGPVLSVVRVDTYDEAVELVNANQYGNGTAVFTNDGGAARRFEADVHVGMIGVNVPVPVPVAYYSFGGWKRSLFGDTHAHGTEGVHFFTRGKVVTTRWIDPANRPQGGLELGFPQND